MRRTLSMEEAREQLTKLPEAFAAQREPVVVQVTRRGEPVLAILPWGLYESIMETLEILSDTETMQALRESMAQLEAGTSTIPLDEAMRRLGWE